MDIRGEIISLLSYQSEQEREMCESLLSLSRKVEMTKREEKANMPFRLNLLDAALEGRMRETAHSRFLWQLLRREKILEGFVRRFFPDNFIVSGRFILNVPDKFHIDISLQTGKEFFIIENKINGAREQCGQIYRYVSHALKRGYSPDNIHVLYLNPETHDSPSEYSLTKDGNGKDSIPKEVDLRIITYKDEIVTWLEDLYSTISDKEVYLKSAIFQYLDYLKETFNISKRYSKMNSKIQSQIQKELFTEDMNCLQRLNTIVDAIAQIDSLKSFLDDLERKEKSRRFQEWFEAIVSEYPIDDYDWVRDNEYDIHINFKYHGYDLSACLTVDNGLCWGIRRRKKPISRKWIKAIHASVQLLLPNAQSNDWWPAWNYTSYENGLDRFFSLIKWVLENEDQPE